MIRSESPVTVQKATVIPAKAGIHKGGMGHSSHQD